MDWIQGIQNAINYIEEHITEDIDYDTLAKIACSSRYHFQRVFGIMCGITVGEYIRRRRLTLAGNDLLTSDTKATDIALFEQPESAKINKPTNTSDKIANFFIIKLLKFNCLTLLFYNAIMSINFCVTQKSRGIL